MLKSRSIHLFDVVDWAKASRQGEPLQLASGRQSIPPKALELSVAELALRAGEARISPKVPRRRKGYASFCIV